MSWNVLTSRSLSRRALLRGAGCAVALPWLDAMAPRLATPPAPPLRAMFVFGPNGKKMDDWRPTSTEAGFALPKTLQPLAPIRSALTVYSRLDLDAGRAHGDGPGDHARASASFLTAAHPRKTDGPDIALGVSVDQVMARAIGAQTPLPSLELGMERGRSAGRCDSGYSCAYTRNIAWSSATTPVTKETRPRDVFRRLFGDPDAARDAVAQERERRRRRSVLDAVREDAARLDRRLGSADRGRLAGYLDSVREFERQLDRVEAADAERRSVAPPAELGASGKSFAERLDLMYELCALAFEADVVRVVTFMLGNAGSPRSYGFLDVPERHHQLSHHRGDESKIAKIGRIDRFHSERFAAFCQRLRNTASGAERTLLDDSMVLFGSGLADGNRHAHHDLPIVVVGHGGGAFAGDAHIRAAKKTPLANLYVKMLHTMGVPAERFGDSTGSL